MTDDYNEQVRRASARYELERAEELEDDIESLMSERDCQHMADKQPETVHETIENLREELQQLRQAMDHQLEAAESVTDAQQEKEYTSLDWYLLSKVGAISTRMANCCRNARIKTKTELSTLVKSGEVIRIKNCGRRTISEMEKFTGAVFSEEQRITNESIKHQKQMLQRCVTILKRNGYEVIPPK